MNKMSSNTKGMYRGLGSIDIAAAVRSILLIGRDKGHENTRVMAHLKSSLAPEGTAIAFELDESGFRWVGKYEMSVEELLYGTSSLNESTKESQAIILMTELLKDGEKPSVEIYSRLAEHNISKRTVENAKSKIGVLSIRKGLTWSWKLPY